MSKQFLIIDGYNLLHTCGFIDDRVGPGGLEKARNLLVGILVKHLAVEDRSRTTLVFDSSQTGFAARQSSHNLLIEFSVDHEDADEHIEQLIRKHSAPRQLTVVSSDHRLHKAARTRGARAIDSDRWLDQLTSAEATVSEPGEEKTVDKNPLPRDVTYWMTELKIDPADLDSLSGEEPTNRSRWKTRDHHRSTEGHSATESPDPSARPNVGQRPADEPSADDVHDSADWADIFPPGYADDLLDSDDSAGPENGR